MSRLAFSLISLALIASVVAGVAAASRSNKWWWDNLAGPDSSNFVASDQIKKSNVSQLDVAWFYPYAHTGFNPIVVDDVMYVLGRGSSLIALDATTGKELWIHEGLAGIISRGVNYWQSEDGKDRRLLVFDQQLPAGDRREDRQDHPDLRRKRDRRFAPRSRARRISTPAGSSRTARARSTRTCSSSVRLPVKRSSTRRETSAPTT